jgi:hypothetical protein
MKGRAEQAGRKECQGRAYMETGQSRQSGRADWEGDRQGR